MNYVLLYTPKAVRDIRRLDSVAKKRIKAALEKFSQDPFHYAQKLVHTELGSYRFRIGDYRVIFDVDGEKIVILRIGHRKDIYRT